MPLELLLERLENVKKTGAGRYMARCPAHADRTASLAIREGDSSVILLHCFALCPAAEVLAAVGLTFDALFPERPIDDGKPHRRPFPASDVLRAVSFEALVVSTIALDMAKPLPLSDARRERLLRASERLGAAASAFDE